MKDKWYVNATDYWSTIPGTCYILTLATVDGVLGGYESISDLDLKSSLDFLSAFYPSTVGTSCDCGAGIGRVAKGLLVKLFDKVDLVESNPAFLKQAQSQYLQDVKDKIGLYIQVGLEDFAPASDRYNLIWCQWVLGHLKDQDLIKFLERCKKSLIDGGMIGIKENVIRVGSSEFDSVDSSVTRSDSLLKEIFKSSGLELVKEETQPGFPRELYPVKMYLLK
jgi:protein N-terminal methyltransferase